MRKEKDMVRKFYDSFGWQKDVSGLYKDTAIFVDTRPVLKWYSRKAHMRLEPFYGGGRYFLDAGSGAIPHPEYLLYSLRYERRVCVDISETALREARSKLHKKGFYVLADLAHLPFGDGVFDAMISAHVLYHVPKDEQRSVIFELHRTLAPRGVCVIIYSQFTSLYDLVPSAIRRIGNALRFFLGGLKLLKRKDDHLEDEQKDGSSRIPQLYAYAHDYDWFRRVLPRGWNIDIRSWSSVNSDFTKRFVPNNLFGRCLMRLVFLLEAAFPHSLAKIGYQMIILRKE